MIITILSILAFQLLLIIVSMIERTIAIPFVTIVLFLVSSRSFSTHIFFLYVSILSIIVASVMMQEWLLVFLVLSVGGIIVRANIFHTQTTFIRVLSLIVVMGVLISVFAQPVISSAYVFHSLLSLLIAAIIGYRWFSLKEKKLRWKNIRFGESE